MRVAIVGAGIVGSAIAYELGRSGNFRVTVLDRSPGPVQAGLTRYESGTGAALGLLMGVICKKEKGRNLQRRLVGLDWYDRAVPELESITGQSIPYNRQGLLMVQFDTLEWEQIRSQWERLAQIRSQQGRRLEIWAAERIQQACPQIHSVDDMSAIYSPDDRQIHPIEMTQALITGATQLGVKFIWNAKIGQLNDLDHLEADVVVVSAGVGSRDLVNLTVRSVLGQAIHLQLPQPLGNPEFQPVITSKDVHVVPVSREMGNRDYWIGGTVEFGTEDLEPIAKSTMLEELWDWSTQMIPSLNQGTRLRVWQGIRPRPVGQPAPVIQWQDDRILLATAHYRNGVLLAPATAIEVREAIETRANAKARQNSAIDTIIES